MENNVRLHYWIKGAFGPRIKFKEEVYMDDPDNDAKAEEIVEDIYEEHDALFDAGIADFGLIRIVKLKIKK